MNSLEALQRIGIAHDEEYIECKNIIETSLKVLEIIKKHCKVIENPITNSVDLFISINKKTYIVNMQRLYTTKKDQVETIHGPTYYDVPSEDNKDIDLLKKELEKRKEL